MKFTTISDLAQGQTALATIMKQVNLHDMYHAYLTTQEDGGEHDRAPGVHASELAACQRQVVYSMYRTEKKLRTTSEQKKRFNVGKAIHDMLQTQFEDMAKKSNGRFEFEREVTVEGTELAQKFFYESHCDGVFRFYDNNELVLRIGLEIKSASEREFAKLNRAQDKHRKQAHLYMKCLDLPLNWYLYWNKGNQNITPSLLGGFLEPFDTNVWEDMQRRTIYCLSMAEKLELPDREEGFHCSWCGYAWTCQPSVNVKASYRNPEPIEHRPISR